MRIVLISAGGDEVYSADHDRAEFPLNIQRGAKLYRFREDHPRNRVSHSAPAAVFVEEPIWRVE